MLNFSIFACCFYLMQDSTAVTGNGIGIWWPRLSLSQHRQCDLHVWPVDCQKFNPNHIAAPWPWWLPRTSAYKQKPFLDFDMSENLRRNGSRCWSMNPSLKNLCLAWRACYSPAMGNASSVAVWSCSAGLAVGDMGKSQCSVEVSA